MREGCKHVYGSFRKNRKAAQGEGLVDQQPGYGGFADAIHPEQSLRAETEPKLSTLRAICNAFGISLAEFFADDAEEKKEETLSIDAEIIRYVVYLNKEQKTALLVLLKSMR